MSGPPEPVEIIRLPSPSWAPASFAVGLTLMALGSFMGWFFAAVGALVVLLAARRWFRQADREVSELPRSQEPTTDVIQPTTL